MNQTKNKNRLVMKKKMAITLDFLLNQNFGGQMRVYALFWRFFLPPIML